MNLIGKGVYIPRYCFNATNVENYSEETRDKKREEGSSPKSFDQDFNKGDV